MKGLTEPEIELIRRHLHSRSWLWITAEINRLRKPTLLPQIGRYTVSRYFKEQTGEQKNNPRVKKAVAHKGKFYNPKIELFIY